MVKPSLFLKVLGSFGLLVVMITVITLLILNVFNQVEKNFIVASRDFGFLNNLERLRHYLGDMPVVTDEYLLNGSPEALETYEAGKKEFDLLVRALILEEPDSINVISLDKVKSLYAEWNRTIGDKKVQLGTMARKGAKIENEVFSLKRLETARTYLPEARLLIRELYRDKIQSQPKRIQIATNLLRGVTDFIGILNITLVFFAIVVGFVLTRSITKPVHLLTEGTQKIMAGKFETINLKRSDELGQLASDFNKMSTILKNNYTRLNAYSELVTALNTYTAEETVEQRSLELICQHVEATVGALYLTKDQNTFELVAGYGLQNRGDRVRRFSLGEGIPGQCAREKRIIEVNDIPSASDFVIDTGVVAVAPRYVIAVPIMFQEEVISTLVLGSMSPFDELKKEILKNSAPQIGIAITNVRNVEATQKLSQEIAKKNEELNSKNVELGKAYKVKSDFLSSMSHELRTPLNSIIGFTSILLGPQGDPLTEDQKKALEKVLRNGKHLLQLINDILDFSKIESGRMPINIEIDEVDSVIASAVATVESLVKSKDIQLVQSISRELPKLHTDILKIKQILVNLLSNAAKFTEKGQISIDVLPHNGMIEFKVKDTGIGIEKKNLELVFQEFQQIDSSSARKYQGTGLGLPISRRLARMLGGDLRVESEYGKGSTFTLIVPYMFPEELKTDYEVSVSIKQRPEPAVEKRETALPDRAQILCIDDDPDVLEILRKYLVPEGYSVVTAMSGDEGIQIATKLRPNLITLDIMMPQKDGWQVLRELKQNPATREIPVLIHSMIDNKPLAISLGARDVLPKPVEASQLLAVVKEVNRSKKEIILIVDDSEDFCDTLKKMLEDDGFRTRIAYNGREAFDVMKSELPALVLLDLLMPVMDGFQFLRKVQDHEKWKDVPIVILSAKELTQKEQQTLNEQITEYMHKRDFSHEALSKTVKRILRRN